MEAQTVTSLLDMVKDHGEWVHYWLAMLIRYGYVILFFWSVLEGELGLFLAGILCYSGDMNLSMAIFVAGLGGFVGDQIYFHIGRYHKNYIQKRLTTQRRKFALAYKLLNRYGWPIIFIQRFLYGLRMIIPMAIGLTRYNSKKFALINLFSGWAWASIIIVPTYFFGKEILDILALAKDYWFILIPLAALLLYGMWFYLHRNTKKKLPRNSNKLAISL